MSALLLVPAKREGSSLRMDHFRLLFPRCLTAFGGLFSLSVSSILALFAYKVACPVDPVGRKCAYFP